MNAVIASPPEMDVNEKSIVATAPATVPPHSEEALQVEALRLLPAVMLAICDDCSRNSIQYVLRSNTGHDGE